MDREFHTNAAIQLHTFTILLMMVLCGNSDYYGS